MPVVLGKKQTGMNTASCTRAAVMVGVASPFMELSSACSGFMPWPSLSLIDCTITTASSVTVPIARMMPNMVSWLMLKPSPAQPQP